MMLKVNRLTDYATVIVCEILSNQNILMSAKNISKKTDISKATVNKILRILTKQKILKSIRGNLGGYNLAKQPKKISLFEIINAIEGSTSLTLCDNNKKNNCKYIVNCQARHGWRKLSNVFKTILKNLTIEEFLYGKEIKLERI